jgi:hypothetical protein
MLNRFVSALAAIAATTALFSAAAFAAVKPGDVITKDNAAKVQDLLSPGNYVLVQRGMQMNIVPTSKLDWPPPFTAATEKYSPQVVLNPDGTLKNYGNRFRCSIPTIHNWLQR